MDGVMVYSEAHFQEIQLLPRLVPGFDMERGLSKVQGTSLKQEYEILVDLYGIDYSYEEYVRRYVDIVRPVYSEMVVLADGLIDLLKQWQAQGLKLAVASSSPKEVIQIVLDRFGLSYDHSSFSEVHDEPKITPNPSLIPPQERVLGDPGKRGGRPLADRGDSGQAKEQEEAEFKGLFNAVVSADDVNGESKPSPKIYLHTANLLDTEPKKCLVFEDSLNGIKAAKAAGMYCIGYGHEVKPDWPMDEVVEGFDKLSF